MSDKEFNYYISGETGKWEVVIGLEVHAQVSSNAKLFSHTVSIRMCKNLSVYLDTAESD